jgi:hypothetical protein
MQVLACNNLGALDWQERQELSHKCGGLRKTQIQKLGKLTILGKLSPVLGSFVSLATHRRGTVGVQVTLGRDDGYDEGGALPRTR